MTMNTNLFKWSLLLSVVAALCLSAASYAQLTTYQQQEWLHSPAASSHIGNLTGAAPAAAMPYRRYCVGCHGPLGDGNGENMQWINPKPRDFQLAIFKCRSTPTGTLPTDQDLYDSISRGFGLSKIPSWDALYKQERAHPPPPGPCPTDRFLYDSISRGLDRSNMPSWNALPKQERSKPRLMLSYKS